MQSLKKIAIVVLLFGIIFSFILINPLGNLDELWNYSFAKNIADGLIPYKDFNMVTTPLLPFIVTMFLKLFFNGLIMTRILAAILLTAVLVMTYLILSKLIKNKYINLFATLNICIIMIPFLYLEYNFLVLLFTLIILNYELKSKDENLLKLNIKKDFLIGILAGLAIITKQSTGLILAVVYVGYKWLAIRSKEDIILAFKISLSRGLGVLVPVIVFLGYLLITNSFNDFINFCIFGVAEFSNSMSYVELLTNDYYNIKVKILAVAIPVVILYTIIYLIKNYKLDALESKNILKLFVFGIASFVVVYPIANDVHFFIGSVILIILSLYIIATHFEIKNDKVKSILRKTSIYLPYILFTMLFVVMCFNYYNYFSSNDRHHNLNHYEGIIAPSGLVDYVNNINGYIKEQEENGNKMYIINADAAFYNMPIDKYNKYFDLPLKGNLGQNGIETVIEKIKSLDENSMILLLSEKYAINWQMPSEIIQVVKENYSKIDSIEAFEVYSRY